MARSLQEQGVPWQSGLRGPQAKSRGNSFQPTRRTVRERTPIDGQMGGTRDTTTYYDYPSEGKANRSRRSGRNYNPATLGSNATSSGVGGLEAEFLLAIVLLVLLMFANSSASYGERVMSLMKRGTLTCLLFFVLALIASTGPGAAKIAKAFGALIIVAILVTSPVTTVMKDVDGLIKNDWVPTSETAGGTSGSDKGTQSGTSQSSSSVEQKFLDALKQATSAGNPLLQTLNGIIPGSGDILKKIFHL